MNIAYESQKLISMIIPGESRQLKVDFYLSIDNAIIEYDGAQHFRPVNFGGISADRAKLNFERQIERDKYKNELFSLHNIRLIRIDGRRFKGNSLIQYVKHTLVPYLDL